MNLYYYFGYIRDLGTTLGMDDTGTETTVSESCISLTLTLLRMPVYKNNLPVDNYTVD